MSKLFMSFLKNDEGSNMVFFGIIAFPVISMVLLGLDAARLYSFKYQLQAATDAATLAALRSRVFEGLDVGVREVSVVVGQGINEAMRDNLTTQIEFTKVDSTPPKIRVSVVAETQVVPYTPIDNIVDVTIRVNAAAEVEIPPVEVYVALDISATDTAGIDRSSINEAVKVMLEDFYAVKEINELDNNEGEVTVSIIPFAQTVRFDKAKYKKYLNPTYSGQFTRNIQDFRADPDSNENARANSWDGCFQQFFYTVDSNQPVENINFVDARDLILTNPVIFEIEAYNANVQKLTGLEGNKYGPKLPLNIMDAGRYERPPRNMNQLNRLVSEAELWKSNPLDPPLEHFTCPQRAQLMEYVSSNQNRNIFDFLDNMIAMTDEARGSNLATALGWTLFMADQSNYEFFSGGLKDMMPAPWGGDTKKVIVFISDGLFDDTPTLTEWGKEAFDQMCTYSKLVRPEMEIFTVSLPVTASALNEVGTLDDEPSALLRMQECATEGKAIQVENIEETAEFITKIPRSVYGVKLTN